MLDQDTFRCDFGGGSSAVVKLNLAGQSQTGGQQNILEVKWTGPRRPELQPRYTDWMHTVLSEAARRLNKRILYALPKAGNAGNAHYVYEPDGTYKQA